MILEFLQKTEYSMSISKTLKVYPFQQAGPWGNHLWAKTACATLIFANGICIVRWFFSGFSGPYQELWAAVFWVPKSHGPPLSYPVHGWFPSFRFWMCFSPPHWSGGFLPGPYWASPLPGLPRSLGWPLAFGCVLALPAGCCGRCCCFRKFSFFRFFSCFGSDFCLSNGDAWIYFYAWLLPLWLALQIIG